MWSGIRGYATIHLKVDIASLDEGPNPPHLFHHGRDEGLAPKAWIHAHHKDQIYPIQQILDGAFRRTGVERDARLLAKPPNDLKRSIEMRPGFRVNRNDIGARLRKGFQVRIARRDLNMHVYRFLDPRPDSIETARPV